MLKVVAAELVTSPGAFACPGAPARRKTDVQRRLAELMPGVSLDCNRVTLDACFGGHFDSETSGPHSEGGNGGVLARLAAHHQRAVGRPRPGREGEPRGGSRPWLTAAARPGDMYG